MIISNSQKFIFVHIVKAAGTSITRALENSLKWNDIVLGATYFGEIMQRCYPQRYSMHKHSTSNEIRDIVGEEVWSNYFTFTIVRHPYDRVVSLYTWVEKMVKTAGFRRYLPFSKVRRKPFWNFPGTKAYLTTRSFSEFIRSEELLKNAMGMRPQSEWLTDEGGKVMVDYIGRVENIDSDFKFIIDTVGAETVKLGVHNKSALQKRNKYLIHESDYDFLYQHFQKDFDILNYDPSPQLED